MKVSPQFVGPIVMAFIMAMIMTGFVTWMNLGFNDAFFVNWGRAFVFAWPVASIAAFLAYRLHQKLPCGLFDSLMGLHRIMIIPNGL